MALRPKLLEGFHVKFFGNARNVLSLGKYLLPLHQFTIGAIFVDDEIDRVSETRLFESCSTPTKRPLGCAQSNSSMDSNDVIVISKVDQVVLDVENEKDKVQGKKKGVASKK